MSAISIDDVKHVAHLSGFTFTDDELEAYREQFEAIITYVERISSVDTSSAAPTYQVTGLTNVMREDEPIDYGVSPDQLLENTPMQQDGQIKVRRVLK